MAGSGTAGKPRARKPVKNADLWQALEAETATHEIDGAGSRAIPAMI
jgi:hypothetical protein